MKKKVVKVEQKGKTKKTLWIVLLVVFGLFFVLPIVLSLFNGFELGNVALISIEGMITGDGASYLGTNTISSKTIVEFLEDAEERATVEAILLEINSPGGSAVASDEIATAVKKMEKPVVVVIREVGASGGYWVASAGDHVIANKMSITGSIGVISSYLEFSGIMEEYGVGYERMVAGEKKDLGTPFRKLEEEEKKLLQSKLDKIHSFFIEEIAENRGLETSEVERLATGEFFLGIEALDLGLVDELGDRSVAEDYLREVVGLKQVDYVKYEVERGLLESVMGVVSEYFFKIGEGVGSVLVRDGNKVMWV